MGQIRLTAEIRANYDFENSGLPAERWAETLFKLYHPSAAITASTDFLFQEHRY
jgi:hypothetical protein